MGVIIAHCSNYLGYGVLFFCDNSYICAYN